MYILITFITMSKSFRTFKQNRFQSKKSLDDEHFKFANGNFNEANAASEFEKRD